MRVTRRTGRLSTLTVTATVAALFLAGCSTGEQGADVTETVTVPPSLSIPSVDGNGKPAASSTPGSPTEASPSPSATGGTGTGPSTAAPSTTAPSTTAPSSTAPSSGGSGTGDFDHPQDGVALPDGFVPRKLKPGEKPPQFVVVSFDGVGWDEKWQYWFGIAKKVPFRFTGFLSGTYLLSDQTKDAYHPPFYKPGTSQINWNSQTDLPVEINDLNEALATGNELGTHFNGHFCADAGIPSGGNTWKTADWNTELDQFFSLLKNYRTNNPGVDLPQLTFKGSDVRGERTPCLEGHEEDLFPALKAHGMTYDSSFTRRGISWPKKSPQYGIWQMGMAEFPMHGTISGNTLLDPDQRTQHYQITMDYNFWFSQEGANIQAGTSTDPAQSKIDSQQVVDTYQDMYDATFNGNRAPLILGNHFNQWNNNAYSDAIGKFVLANCGRADTQCVPFRDVIAWMEVQDPARLAQLQNQQPELGTTS